MDNILFNGKVYPYFQAEGNASQFAIPFARKVCKGIGVDIGFCKDDWKLPGALGADLDDDSNNYHALNLPKDLDYIYSSHCLEHLTDWVRALEYWTSRIKVGGIIFLYLPHHTQEYWNPWNNRKHLNNMYVDDIVKCLKQFGIIRIFSSERDLNHSFMVYGTKA